MQDFQVRAVRDERRLCVHAGGELDLATVPLLEACVREHVAGDPEQVTLELREVSFIDSTGVRLLLTLEAEARADGWALTIEPSDAVRHVVGLLGLQERLLAPQFPGLPVG